MYCSKQSRITAPRRMTVFKISVGLLNQPCGMQNAADFCASKICLDLANLYDLNVTMGHFQNGGVFVQQ